MNTNRTARHSDVVAAADVFQQSRLCFGVCPERFRHLLTKRLPDKPYTTQNVSMD